jgi:hypothetical protein
MIRYLSRLFRIFSRGSRRRMDVIFRDSRRFAGNVMREREYEREQARRRLQDTEETLNMLRVQVTVLTEGDNLSNGNGQFS